MHQKHALAASAAHTPLAAVLQDSYLSALAKTSGLTRRKAKKLPPSVLLGACLAAVGAVTSSYFSLAVFAGVFGGNRVSRQALHKRFSAPLVKFLHAVLSEVMRAQAGDASKLLPEGSVVQRILVADSSTLKLHPSLKEHFPGSSNQCGSGAALKIQATLDLLSGSFVAFLLCGFTRNDQAAANDILALIKVGDLILRDLGYLTLESLRGIAEAGAFFVSRYSKMHLFTPEGTALSLKEVLLRHRCQTPGTAVDIPVLLGKEGRLPVRLVAIKLDDKTASERRRKARADRDKRLQHSREFYALLGWSIFITNLPVEGYSAAKIYKLYIPQARDWRVEILFKSFKGSGLRLPEMLRGRIGAHQVSALSYAALIVAVLNAQFIGAPTLRAGEASTGGAPAKAEGHSLLKGAKLMSLMLLPLLMEWLAPPGRSLSERLGDQFRHHTRHDRRRRTHFPQDLITTLALS